MEIERNRTKSYDLDNAFQELPFEAADLDDIREYRMAHEYGSGKSDPWLSRAYWDADLFETARMADMARRG